MQSNPTPDPRSEQDTSQQDHTLPDTESEPIRRLRDLHEAVEDRHARRKHLWEEIQGVDDEIERLKSQFEVELAERWQSIPYTEAVVEFGELYWLSWEHCIIARRIAKLAFREAPKAPWREREEECPGCKTPRIRVLKNWNDARMNCACEECSNKFEADRSRILSSARQRREQGSAQEREWLDHIRRMPYPEYLKTSHWQQVRRWALKNAEYRCQLCNADNRRMDVHHRTYERLGQERATDIFVLCSNCHEKFHDIDGGDSHE